MEHTAEHRAEKPVKASINQVLLLLAAACLGAMACLYLAPGVANAQRAGPFTLVAHNNNTANVGIFRIDQSSGAVTFCIVEDRTLATHCGPAAQ